MLCPAPLVRGPRGLAHVMALSAIWLLLVSSCPAQELVQKVDEYLNQVSIQGSHFSGSILIARDGKVLVNRSYGMANLENAVPNTAQTKFRLGSLTKQFTAVAVMILEEQGALKLQDSICKYLSPCPDNWQPITLHHLLTHTSGLPDADYTEAIVLPMLAAHTVEHLQDQRLLFGPGRAFHYSNANYVLLGHIIERVSRQSYQSFVREKIFQPLGMNDSGYDDPGLILLHRASGYSFRGDRIVNAAYIDMSIPFSAGGLYSTTEDLYRWMQALFAEKLVSRRSLAAIFTPVKNTYGYGWYITTCFNRRYINHGGWIDGFASAIAYLPDERLTVIALSNRDNAPVNTITRNLSGIALGLKQETVKERRPIKIDPRSLEA